MKRKWRVVLIALIGATVLCIWGNSMRSAKISKEQSDTVKEILTDVITEHGTQKVTPKQGLLIRNVRKVAHLVEYAALGLEVGLLAAFFYDGRGWQRLWNALSVALTVAVADEAIQIWSGRGSLVSDILLDSLASFPMIAAFFLAACLVNLYRRYKQKRAQT